MKFDKKDEFEEHFEEKDDLLDEDLDFDDNFNENRAPIEAKSDLLKNLTDFDPFLKTKISDWLGVTWSQKDNAYIEKEGIIPTMNIQGVSKCISFLRTYARNNNILTQLNTQNYNNIMEDVIFNAHAMVGIYAEEFGIKDNMNILLIADDLIHSTTLVLVGAGGESNYKKFLGTAVTRNENIRVGDTGNNISLQRKSPGFLARSWKAVMGG